MSATHSVELRDVHKRFGGMAAVDGVSLQVRQGEFLTLLGPSGCGKTTTLRMVAGFERPSGGEVLIAGQVVTGLPPNRRDVHTVFQNYALFPHMNVAQNVGFGLRMKWLPRAEIARRVEEALALVRLEGLGGRRPSQLSGGQQQRVALARALINRPAVLLLDEPLGALDLKLRKEMQVELKQLQRRLGMTFLYVTHDQEEALTMSDRIAVMNAGRIEQIGPPVEIYGRPQTRFVAGFVGETNLLSGAIEPGGAALVVDGERLPLSNTEEMTAGQQVSLSIRPEMVQVRPEGAAPAGGRVSLRGFVEETIFVGPVWKTIVRLPGGTRVIATEPPRPEGRAAPGTAVRVEWAMESAVMLAE
jgi:spermidine/putrescine transport system ATP-binding protein